MGITTRKTIDQFVSMARDVHGDAYDYTLITSYKNNKTKVPIICPIHGVFYQMPEDHIYKKSKCPNCSHNKKHTNSSFIDAARKVHGDKYNYAEVCYKNSHSKVKIICPTHGLFETKPNGHLCGQGCPSCGKEKVKTSIEDFIKNSRQKHGNKYLYKKVKYVNSYTKVEIVCPVHGSFWQTPESHSRKGYGCPLCSTPKGESKIIQYLMNNKIDFIAQKIFLGNPRYSRLRFDFYVPFYNLLIEFNGRQHYEAIDYFKHNRSFEYQQDVDKRKEEFAVLNSLQLLVIPYWDFERVDEILDSVFYLSPVAR